MLSFRKLLLIAILLVNLSAAAPVVAAAFVTTSNRVTTTTTTSTRRNGPFVLSVQDSSSSSSLSTATTTTNDDNVNVNNNNNIRLNKVFKATHSRRKADALIADGRVQVNGEIVEDMGRRVIPFQDTIQLDGQPYKGWEERHGLSSSTCRNGNQELSSSSSSKQEEEETTVLIEQQQDRDEEYIKYWKPVGVTSTTDRTIRGNMIDALESSRNQYQHPQSPIQHRIFTVGRLDKDSSGIILLTSDGRVPNAVLRSKFKRPKTYYVRVDRPMRPSDVKGLRNGIRITTDRVRRGKHESITAKTLPCKVSIQHHPKSGDEYIKITLTEGRNRQIRVMMDTLGYKVIDLHRDDFMGINLRDLNGPGDWKRLTKEEREILDLAIRRAEQE